MRPYQKQNKKIKIPHLCEINRVPRCFSSTLKIPIAPVWSDIKYIWLKDPPFPASIRIILTFLLICVLTAPLLFILVPPILSISFIYLLYFENCPTYNEWLELPDISSEDKKYMLRTVQDIFKKVMLRISIFVTLCDYIQIFRALGYIHL